MRRKLVGIVMAFMLALILCLAGITPLNVEAEEVTAETAYEDACKLEHGLSDESFMALKNYFNL